MEKNIIICDDASVSFKKFQIGPVNLNIPCGYIVGVQGNNGSGKSTLLRMLAGQYPKMSGSITLDGIDVTSDREQALSRLAVVSEDMQYFYEETISANEKLFSPFFDGWNHDLFIKCLEIFGLSKGDKVGALSKGQKVKLQMAFAVAHNPKVILLDEPTAGLDPVAREDFLKMIQIFVAEYEMTVILATHLDEDISRIADYLIRIDDGICEMSELVR